MEQEERTIALSDFLKASSTPFPTTPQRSQNGPLSCQVYKRLALSPISTNTDRIVLIILFPQMHDLKFLSDIQVVDGNFVWNLKCITN